MTCATIRRASAVLLAVVPVFALAAAACSKHDDAAPADAAPAGPPGIGTLGPSRSNTIMTSGPRGVVTLGPPKTSVPIANAERVLAGTRARFRLCYNQGLAGAPGMAGDVTLSAKLAPNGDVDSVDATKNTGVADGVVKCVTRALGHMQFDGPGPGGATLEVTLSLAVMEMPDGGWPVYVAPVVDAGANTGAGRDLKGGAGDGIGAPDPATGSSWSR